MAIKTSNIIFTIKDVYSDFDRDLARQSDGDVKRITDYDAVKGAIRNILQTSKGSRRMMPDFGASLERFLFEPMDDNTSRRIGAMLLEELTFWEPRIVVENVNIEADYDNLQYTITLSFTIEGAGTQNIERLIFVLRRA